MTDAKGRPARHIIEDLEFTVQIAQSHIRDKDAEIERLRSALAALVSDLNDRAVGGFVDCSASVWIGANAALNPKEQGK
jgi:hypothetical protein